MKKINILSSIISSIVFSLALSSGVLAADAYKACSEAQNGSVICGDTTGPNLQSTAKNFVNVGLWVVGVASVIVIIVAGIYYVISAGNADTVKKAKNALMYAVVGLVVSLLSYTIVNYVVDIF